MVVIEFSIVTNNIPLLLSSVSIKWDQVILNFTNDVANVLSDRVDLMCTSLCH